MTYASEVLADSPATYWRLGETSGTTAADLSGNSRNGTYSGSYTLGQAGLLPGDPTAKSTLFATSSNGMVTGGFVGAVTACSLEVWIKIPSGNPDPTFIIGAGGGLAPPGFLNLNSGQANFFTNIPNGNYQQVTGAGSIRDGNPHHIVGTWDGTTIRLYRDGIQVGIPVAVSGTSPSSSPFAAAGHPGTGGRTDGHLQEAAYYTTALSAARIAAHYAAGTAASTTTQVGQFVVEALEMGTPANRVGQVHVEALVPQAVSTVRVGQFGVEALSMGVPQVRVGQVGVQVLVGAAPPGPSWSVWNGTSEVPATATVWNGTSEVATTTEIAP